MVLIDANSLMITDSKHKDDKFGKGKGSSV